MISLLFSALRRVWPLCLLITSLALAGRLSASPVSITSFLLTAAVTVETDTNHYYLLLRGTNITVISGPVAMALGTGHTITLFDTNRPPYVGFYQVEAVSLTAPLDSDGDGMDDVFELTYPTCLNPLDPADAGVDCDGDGLTNLQEYLAGTNPTVAEAGPVHVVINEIDYDQPGGTDDQEFVEIYNAGLSPISMANKALVFVNGNNNLEYLRVPLAAGGILAPGGYLVVGSSNLVVTSGVPVIRFAQASNAIQNGAPDGVALVNVATSQLLDAFSYEGSITAAVITGFPAPVSLVEGTALSALIFDDGFGTNSLIRWPNGADMNNATNDWRLSSTPTPGRPNAP